MVDETAIGGAARGFPGTRWTTILSSRSHADARRTALDELLGAYWKPLYFYVRRKGLDVEAAKDAVQGFFTQWARSIAPSISGWAAPSPS